ncbi:MAG: hypothetical protein DME69_01495 [Verrucomicrobia bacterium]|nr:MAG: hypothetical protein DME87_00250 [Verrucomicrobiota bacterium]PYJ80259.1 MAG: hypothetical protein DME69_01495 [Verrucomicrobiota bacterium]
MRLGAILKHRATERPIHLPSNSGTGSNGPRTAKNFAFLGSSRLEHGQHRRMLEVARRNAFEVRSDATQFGSHKTVDKIQAPIQPGNQLVLDLIVNRKRDLRAGSPNLGEINDSHKVNIAAHGLERILIWRVTLDRQKDCVSLKTKRAAKAEIDRFR